MAAGDGYVNADTLAAYIASANNETAIPTDNRETELEAACAAASRRVEEFCNRVFWDADSATARVYSARHIDRLDLDEFHTTTGLVIATDTTGDGTYDTTWSSTDYQLEPVNGVRHGRPGWPYSTIRAVGDYRFPVNAEARVQVTARWGWADIPAEVTQATLITAHRLFMRATSPEGVAGFDQLGAVFRVARVDPDVADLLDPVVRKALIGFA